MSGSIMQNDSSEIDKKIKERLESIYYLNSKWMKDEQFRYFINYKLYRENMGDVILDSKFMTFQLPDLSEKKVLDVGCGTGDLLINLALKNIDIIGVDMSEDDIEIAKLKSAKYNLAPSMFQVQNGARLPYPDEHFDVVACIEVLEHTGRDYMAVLREIFRVLKRNGILYMTIPNRLCPYDTHLYTWIPHWLPKWIRIPYLNRIRGEKAKKENYLLDYNFFSPNEIKNILKTFSPKIDVNEKYLNFRLGNIYVNDKDSYSKFLMKKIVSRCCKADRINSFVVKFISIFYFFQSIKVLVEKE